MNEAYMHSLEALASTGWPAEETSSEADVHYWSKQLGPYSFPTNEMKTTVWSTTPPLSSDYIMVGCMPGDYLLEPPIGINSRQRDPTACTGLITMIHRNDLWKYKEKLDHRPVWFFADKQAWWDKGCPKCDGSELRDDPIIGDSVSRKQVVLDLAAAQMEIGTRNVSMRNSVEVGTRANGETWAKLHKKYATADANKA